MKANSNLMYKACPANKSSWKLTGEMASNSHFPLAKPAQVISNEVEVLTSRTLYQHYTVVIGLFWKLFSTACFTHLACVHHVECAGNVTNHIPGNIFTSATTSQVVCVFSSLRNGGVWFGLGLRFSREWRRAFSQVITYGSCFSKVHSSIIQPPAKNEFIAAAS